LSIFCFTSIIPREFSILLHLNVVINFKNPILDIIFILKNINKGNMTEESKASRQSNSQSSSNFADVKSKLFVPTAAYNAYSIKNHNAGKENEHSPKPVKPIENNHNLLRPTHAFVNGAYRRDAEEREAEQRAALERALSSQVVVADRLLSPTASNIHSTLQLPAAQQEREDENDIWWEKKKSSKTEAVDNIENIYDHVESKLYSSTAAYDSLVQSRLEKASEVSVPGSKPLPIPIDDDSPVLRPTYAALYGSYYKPEPTPEPPKPSMWRRLSQQTGPKQVESKLLQPTVAYKSAVFKSKEDREIEEEVRREAELATYRKEDEKKVFRPSERVLMPTQSLIHATHQRRSQTSDSQGMPWKHPSRSVTFGSNEGASTTSSMKVAEPSASLLRPTIGFEHAQWKGNVKEEVWHDKEKDAEIVVSDRLLEYTANMRNSVYHRPEAEADTRELTWKSHTVKAPKDIFAMKEEPGNLSFLRCC
jgi:hypothetical protein